MKYSVLYDPVISVSMMNGETRDIGLYDAFRQASDIRDIQGDSPLERFAVLRLLTAFAMDMIHPKSWMDRKDLLEEGSFDTSLLDAYIADCEKDGSRFDLFDPEHPFMQARYNSEYDKPSNLKTIENLSITLPSGNNHIFLNHCVEGSTELTPMQAFKYLLVLYVFSAQSGRGYTFGVNNGLPIYAWVQGGNLFETLVLNMVAENECRPIEYGLVEVPWRKESVLRGEIADISFLEALTWQSRRVTLVPEEDGFVKKLYIQMGPIYRGKGLWFDPNVAYRYTKKGEWESVKPQNGRALWRDVGTLLIDQSGSTIRPPLVIMQAPRILDTDSVWLNIAEVGLTTKTGSKGAYGEWMEDQFSLPRILLINDVLAMMLRDDIEVVEKVEKELRKQIYQHLIASKENEKQDSRKKNCIIIEQASICFLSGMHDYIFTEVVPKLCSMENNLEEETRIKHKDQLIKNVMSVIDRTFKEVIEQSGISSNHLKRQSDTYRGITAEIHKIQKEKGGVA